eukprot:TRINITY_DN1316_c0_g1_i1.p1 TRINITY_DN1316_c0_g1~~TRINITY_DN1316_c0_g1_i1.p1  ORF type:complete len:118 (+),score=29.07 TRINITY_DN1316_c0_g1_i1:635-988(+)
MSQFKDDYNFQKREEVALSILARYPDRIPVIVERASNSDAPLIDKKKFLVPRELTVGKFVFEIRKHMPTLPEEKAIFLFVEEVLPPSTAMMNQIYEKHKDQDGFLYINYSGENTFGL